MKATINRIIRFLLIPICLLLFTASCNNSDASHAKNKVENKSHSTDEQNFILPIKDIEGSFYTVTGWLDDNTIVYVTEHAEGANIYTYNLRLGQSELLYSEVYPISTVQISPNKKYILVHSSPNTGTGTITVIHASGKIVMQTEIVAKELSFEWNDQNDNKLLITSFREDWTYQTFELDISLKSLEEKKLPQPFVHYVTDDEVEYLDWDNETPALSAPLKSLNLTSLSSKVIKNNVFHLDVKNEGQFTITVEESGDQAQGTYSFYNTSLEKVREYRLPMISLFSGWLVPYYEFQPSNQLFYTMEPEVTNRSVDGEVAFNLIQYSIGSDKREMIFSNLENEPISCSPNGKQCLFGFQLDQLLKMDTKERIQIVSK